MRISHAVKAGIRSVFACLLLVGVALGQQVELKVMSFNIRYSYGKPQEDAAENDWADPQFPRRERAIRVICEFAPDILGVQEARDLQANQRLESSTSGLRLLRNWPRRR
jgi:hypothetical protein